MLDDKIQDMSPGAVLLDAPISSLVERLSLAIADAQLQLDRNSIRVAWMLGNNTVDITDKDGKTHSRSLLELGFTPSFYHFTEAFIEVKLNIVMKVEESFKAGLGISIGQVPGQGEKKPTEGGEPKPAEGGEGKPAEGGGEGKPAEGGGEGKPAEGGGEGKPAEGGGEGKPAEGGGVVNPAEGGIAKLTAEGGEGKPAEGGGEGKPAEGGGGKSAGDKDKPGEELDRPEKQAIPFGVSVSMEYSRKYNFDVSGSSTMSAKLVSVPAPTAFLEAIRAATGSGGGTSGE